MNDNAYYRKTTLYVGIKTYERLEEIFNNARKNKSINMSKINKIKWLDTPEEHDYPAAESYLSLFFDKADVNHIISVLKHNDVVEFKAKDIFRASELSLLGVSNSHVLKNILKIKSKEKLSPILLVRSNGKLIVADGYHRLCAVYSFDEDAFVPCKIVGLN